MKKINLSLLPILSSLFLLFSPTAFKLFLAEVTQDFFFFPAKFIKGELNYLKNLKRERDELANRLTALTLQMATQPEGLRDSLVSSPLPLLRAEIVGRDNTLRCFLIVNKGKKDGVREAQPAIVADGVIGKVLRAGEFFSLIETFYSPYAKIACFSPRSAEVFLLKASKENWSISRRPPLKLLYVSPDTDIRLGDTLFTTGEGIFPKGLLVGFVTKIIPTPDIFLDVWVQPAVDILKVSTLYLMTKKEEERKLLEKRELEKVIQEMELKIPDFFKVR